MKKYLFLAICSLGVLVGCATFKGQKPYTMSEDMEAAAQTGASVKFFPRYGCSGGAAGDLDDSDDSRLSVANLADGDVAIVVDESVPACNGYWVYHTPNTTAELVPVAVRPDDYGTDYGGGAINGVWIKQDIGLTYTDTTSKSANYTIGTDDPRECYGGVIYVTGAATITACDNLHAGMGFTVITIGAIAVSLDVQADDRQILDGTALDDGDKATNTSTTGDLIVCTYESASGWYCASGSNDGTLWSDGG